MIHIEGDAIKNTVAYTKEYVDTCFVSTGAAESIHAIRAQASVDTNDSQEPIRIYSGYLVVLEYDRFLLADNEKGELYFSGGHWAIEFDYCNITFNYSFGDDNNLYLLFELKPGADVGVDINILHRMLFPAWYIAREFPDIFKIGNGSFSAMVDKCRRREAKTAKQMITLDLAVLTLRNVKRLTEGSDASKDIRTGEVYVIIKYYCKYLSLEMLEAFMAIIGDPVLNAVVYIPTALTAVELLTSIYKLAKHDKNLSDQQRDIIMRARKVYYRVPHVPIC